MPPTSFSFRRGVDVSLSDGAAGLETVLSHTPSRHLGVCVCTGV